MQQSQHQPLYAAKDRVPFNLTLVLALGIAVWGVAGMVGILPPPGNPEMIIVLGLAVTAYTWLFTPKEYMVFNDAVCVAYGKPRVKTIHFSNIAMVEMGSMATIDQLRIRPVKGRRQSIRVRDPEAFYDQLELALNAYRAAHPEEDISYQLTGRHPPAVVEGEPVEMVDADAETETLGAKAQDAAPQSSPSESGGDLQDPTVEQSATDEMLSIEGTVQDNAPEDPEKPSEPGNRSFY